MPKGSTPRGDGPRTPVADVGVPPPWLSDRGLSSAKLPGGKKAGLSLPYKALCWRARSSRRLSSLMAAGLSERSDLFPDISASRPLRKEKNIKTHVQERNHVPMYYTMQPIHVGKGRSHGEYWRKKPKKRKKKKSSKDKCYHVLRLYCCSW